MATRSPKGVGQDVPDEPSTPKAARDEHMVGAMAQFMARILETKPCLFVRSAQLLSWVAADAPTFDPSRPRCRSCGDATLKRRVLCEACRRNPIVMYGAPLIDTMFRSSNPLYAMDETKQRIIVFLKREQQLAENALALAEQLADWGWRVYRRQCRGGDGNVYFSRELCYGSGVYAQVVRCGLDRTLGVGGLGLRLHKEVYKAAVEWLFALDAHVREHFEIPLGHVATGDVSFMACVENLASLIANRVTLFEDPTNSDPSQILCSRGCEHLARLQHLRCEFYAHNAVVADIEGMRALVRLARDGAPPANPAPLLALLRQPPPELLSLLPSVASDMGFAALRDALGTGAAADAFAAWRAAMRPESLVMLLERAIATAQAWRAPPSGFLMTLRFDAARARKHHLPHMKWIDDARIAYWSLLPRALHAHRRVGLDPTGERIVLMCSALMQIDAHEEPKFFVPGVARCDLVLRVAQREMNLASHAHAHLREELRPFTAGLEWDTSRRELLHWKGSHLEEDVRCAARLLGGYSLRELHARFLDGRGHVALLDPATAMLVHKPRAGYVTWCEASLELLLPILQQYRESLGLADNVATHPDGEVLRLLPRARDWTPDAGALTLTTGEARELPPLKALLLRLQQQGLARCTRPSRSTKMLWVVEPDALQRMLLPSG